MATNAERQAAYRAARRARHVDEMRLNTYISAAAFYTLERLARHYGVTKKEALERVLEQHERDLLPTLESRDAYFGVTA